MSEQPQRTSSEWNGLDVGAILASLQDQIDELTQAVAAQQRQIEALTRQLEAGDGDGAPQQ